jgi:hypothetical protein
VAGDNVLDLKGFHANMPRRLQLKNPLPATLWFLKNDATAGLLEESGFSLSQNSSPDDSLYSKDGFVVFSQGFWYDRGDHYLVYRNPSRSFYRLPKGRDPLGIPGMGEEKIRLEEGFRVVEPLLSAHEQFVTKRMGSAYRARLMQTMPRSEKRYAKNWKVAFRCEKRSVTW